MTIPLENLCIYPSLLGYYIRINRFWGCCSPVGLLFMCRLPANLQVEVQDPRLSDDKFDSFSTHSKHLKQQKQWKSLQYAPLELINGNDQESSQVVIPLEERGFEPNETDTDMLLKVGIMTTILVI